MLVTYSKGGEGGIVSCKVFFRCSLKPLILLTEKVKKSLGPTHGMCWRRLHTSIYRLEITLTQTPRAVYLNHLCWILFILFIYLHFICKCLSHWDSKQTIETYTIMLHKTSHEQYKRIGITKLENNTNNKLPKTR